ncbi:MAG: hypothetical protein WAL69_12725, partial [Candidatus Acidiferrales bacterium]
TAELLAGATATAGVASAEMATRAPDKAKGTRRIARRCNNHVVVSKVTRRAAAAIPGISSRPPATTVEGSSHLATPLRAVARRAKDRATGAIPAGAATGITPTARSSTCASQS